MEKAYDTTDECHVIIAGLKRNRITRSNCRGAFAVEPSARLQYKFSFIVQVPLTLAKLKGPPLRVKVKACNSIQFQAISKEGKEKHLYTNL